MKKAIALSALLVLVAVSVALAAAPKPMACDSFKCGPKCAPAKYEAVRYAPTLLPLFGSQIYGAAVVEGGIGFLAALLGSGLAAKRRAAARAHRAPAAEASEGGKV